MIDAITKWRNRKAEEARIEEIQRLREELTVEQARNDETDDLMAEMLFEITMKELEEE